MKYAGTLFFTTLVTVASAFTALAADIEIDGGNSILVDGTATNGTTLYVGRYDDGNYLTITNAGSVSGETGYIGQNSDHNVLLITGINSSLQLSEALIIGENGKSNSLYLAEGGWVSIGTTNNMTGAINVGNTNGIANLSMNNGSTANADFLYAGTATNESGTVTLTGSDTKLTVADSAFIGMESSNNTITVSDSATLVVSNLLQVGSSTSSNNVLTIGDKGQVVIGGSIDVLNPDNNQVKVQNGGHLTYLGNANLSSAADGGFSFVSGSTLEVGGMLQFGKIDSGMTVILNNGLNTNLTSSWNTGTGEMYVGDTVGNNTLTIQEGAAAVASGSTAHIGEKSNNNTLNVTGTNSTLTVTGRLITGMQGDRNKLDISNGGQAIISNDLRVAFSSTANNNEISVSESTSVLDVMGNAIIGEKGNNNSLKVTDASLNVGNSLYIGLSGSGNSATMTGSNAVTTVGGNLLIGPNGDGKNELNVEADAMMSITGNAYLGTNSANNAIIVTGTNSLLSITGNLAIGNQVETNSNTGNVLSIFDIAKATVGGDLDLRNSSYLQIEPGSQLKVGGNYWQDESSAFRVGIGTNNLSMTNLIVTGTAHFATNTTIQLYDFGIGTSNIEQVIVSSTGLFIGTNSATTALLNDTNSINFINALLDIQGLITNESIVVKTASLSIAEKSGLVGTSLEPLANEIDQMAQAGNPNAVSMRNILGLNLTTDAQRNAAMNNYYGEKMSSTPAHNAINIGMHSFAEELTKRADSTRVRMGVASSSGNARQPVGAEGPNTVDQELQGWFTGYGTWIDKKSTDGFDAYDGNISGFMLGADLSVAEGILFGIAGGTGSSTLDKDNGASVDTRSTYGSVYASAGTKDWFADASLIYGSSRVDAKLGPVFDTKAKYDARNFAFYFGGGKEILGEYLIVTPQASFLGNYYKQDAYSEESSTAVGRDVDSFDTFYLQSTIGCNIGMYATMGRMTVKPEVYAFWLHEFNAKEEDLTYRLSGNANNFVMTLQAPEEDIIKLGAGISTRLGDYLELRFAADTRFGQDYSDHTLLGSLRYQF